MSLSEQRVLTSIEVLPEQNAINVRWDDQILRDGDVISSSNFRRAYGVNDRMTFITDIASYVTPEVAEMYANAAGMNA